LWRKGALVLAFSLSKPCKEGKGNKKHCTLGMSFPRRRRDLSTIREMRTITEQTAATTHVGVYANVRMATYKMKEELIYFTF
jgi:hypothetical protein